MTREAIGRRVVALVLAGSAGVAFAAPPGLQGDAVPEGVGIDQRVDAQLPLDVVLADEDGRPVSIGDYFGGEKPVLLIFNYYRCPMLCGLVLAGMVDVLSKIDWLPGREFEVVVVSIDPREKPALAAAKKRAILEGWGRPEAAAGMHFLTGGAGPIGALTDAAGFRYRYLEEQNEYAHGAAMIILTPDGRVSRYLFGVSHEPRTVRLSLVEASTGKIGGVVEQFLLYCYRYDAVEGRYIPVAWKIMRVGGALSALLVGALLCLFWVRELRQKRLA